jgi:cation diffusion facilitator family transporter
MSADHGSLKAVFFALGGNLLIAIIKFIVAFFTLSSAMLAEAIHSVADCANQVFLLIGNKRSAKKPTEQHPFGYGKEEYFWGFMVAVLLFFVGAIFSVYEGIHKLSNPSEIQHVYWSFAVLAAAIIIESKSFNVAYKEFRKKFKSVGFVKALKESTDTNLFVILMEDFAALTGLGIVLISILLAWLVDPVFDAIGSILVGVLLATISVFLSNELRKLIIGENISRTLRNELKSVVAANSVVKHVNSINAMVIGKGRFLLVISVDIENNAMGHNIEDQLNEIRKDLLALNSDIHSVYMDVRDLNRSTH